jgi:sec-independent protein translocase protein TatC
MNTIELLEEEKIEESARMTLWEHLDELRRRLVFSLLTVFIGFVICWFFREQIWQVVQAPFIRYVSKGDRLSFISLTEPFLVYMKMSALASVILTSPVLITQLWLFISPGLYKHERKFALPFIFFSTICFVGGCLFAYYYVFPFACNYFLEVGRNFKQEVRINDYFSLFSKLILSIGLIFETPILALFLSKLGIVNHRMLLRKFKYAIIGAFVISAVITPTPDMVTQTILAVPMIGLYAVSIVIAWMFGRKPSEQNV